MLGDLFDPKSEYFVSEHLRPHWSQNGAIVFVTFRTHDSIPSAIVAQWDLEKQQWLASRGYSEPRRWSDIVPTLTEKDRAEFQRHFERTRDDFLDGCAGRCLLRRPEFAQIVAQSLLHFDGVRYRMGDFIVMPNHVHLLCAFPSPESMAGAFDSWLHYTAVRINRALGESGRFWQGEPFDHLVRSWTQYEYFREYIAANPVKAGLKQGEYIHWRLEE